VKQEELKNFITSLIPVILKAGEVALSSQGKVKNIGKEIEHLQADSPYVLEKRQAKTFVDEQVQEILLQALPKIIDVNEVKLDTEETTPSTKLFTSSDAKLTLVLDPIDGTLEYLRGEDDYSICVGLLSSGEIITALVYYPVRKILYFIDYDGKPYKTTYNHNLEKISEEPFTFPTSINKKIIYRNNRVSSDISTCLAGSNFQVIDEDNGKITWPEGLLKCMSGEYYVCLFHTPQIRDVLLGAIIEKMGGYALDWNGNKLIWPDGGRTPRVIFGFGQPSKELLTCVQEE